MVAKRIKTKQSAKQKSKKRLTKVVTKERETGITLIALIITVIIMVILAAITISVVVDSRLIETAISSTENYIEASENENNIIQNTIEYLDNMTTSVNSGDAGESAETETESSTLIGKYVDYTPDSGNSYDLTASTYTGNTNNSTVFTTDKTLNWQIWSITDDTLTLIADTTAQSGGYDNTSSSSYGWCLYLTGNLGYNNGVYLLNDICETLYSNSELGATARSLNIQDIEEVLDWSVWAPTDYYYSSSYDSYTYISTKQYTSSSYRYYPGLWPDEDYANIDGTTVNTASYTYNSETGTLTYTGSALRRSDQTALNTTARGKASSYIEPTETYWKATASTLSSAWTDSKYASLVNCGKFYWLASRCVGPRSARAGFGLRGVYSSGCVRGSLLVYSSSSNTYGNYRGVRPIVSIPLTSLRLDTASNSGDSADDAYQLVSK